MNKRLIKIISCIVIITHLFSICVQSGAFAESKSVTTITSSKTAPSSSSSQVVPPQTSANSSQSTAKSKTTIAPKTAMTMSVAGGSSSSSPASMNQSVLKSFQNDPFTGRATFSVPIQNLPGRKGIQPALALTYASGQGNSSLGIGWSLELGHIERSTKKGVPVYDDIKDTFIFVSGGASQELVNIPGTNDYRPKIEAGFSKMTYDGIYWRIIDKSGTKYYLGQTQDSIQKNSAAKIFSWYINRVEDINGYYMTFAYTQDANQIYPLKVSYTGYTPKNELPSYSLEFTLEDRTDTFINYRTGIKIETKKRIKQIDVKYTTQLISNYKLEYQYNTANQSLLTTVTQYGKDGTTALPPIRFSYQAKQSTVDPVTRWDGVFSNNNDYSWGSPRATFTDGHAYVELFDINGDGLPDRVMRSPNGPLYDHFDVQLNNGHGFDPVITWTGVYAYNNAYYYGVPRYTDTNGVTYADMADINGDGLPDRVMRSVLGPYDHFDVQLNNGHGFDPVISWPGVYAYANDYSWGSPRATFTDGHAYVELFDINGDGLPDRVMRSPNGPLYDHFDVQLNNGHGFDPVITWTGVYAYNNAYYYGVPRYTDTNGVTYADMVDINGDGLPDRVMRSVLGPYDHFDVQLNNGHGFDPVISWPGVYAYANDYSWGSPRATFTDGHAYVELFDINGDGLPDRVMRSPNGPLYDHFDVQLNNGHGFDPVITWTGVYANANSYCWGSPRASSAGITYADILDINGDGLSDRVMRSYNPPYDHWDVQNNSNQTPNLLSSIDNGMGGTIQIEYTPSTKFDNKDASGLYKLPFPAYVVSKVTSCDGQGHSYSSTSEYKGGYFDTTEREFRGFKEVKSIDVDGNYTVTTFKQDSLFKGRPDTQETRDKNGVLYSRTENTWKNKALTPGDFVYLEKTISYLYDGDTQNAPLQTQVSYEYDSYGNPTKVVSSGDVSVTGDEKTQNTEYVYNTSVMLLGLPKTTKLLDANNNVLSQKWFYYDNATSVDTVPAKGYLTKEEAKVTDPITQSSQIIATRYSYNEYNLLATVTNALNQTTSTTYDALTHSYPIQATNGLGQSVKTVYYGINETANDGITGSGLFGQVKYTQDLNSQKAFQIYDALGRLTKAIGPLDTEQYPAVIYEYDLASRPIKITKKVCTLYEASTVNYELSYSFCDGLGRVIESKSPAQADPQGNRRQVISGLTIYDQRGLVKEKYLPYFVNESSTFVAPVYSTPHVTFDYDAMGRLVKTTNADSTSSSVSYNRLKVTSIDEKNISKSSYKDIYGRIIKIEEKNGSQVYTTLYNYDALGNLIKLTDNQNNITQIFYDSLGRKLKMIDPDMGTWLYEYDAIGNLTKQTDAKAQVLAFDYDALNRIITKRYPLTATTLATYSYDDTSKQNCIGRLSKVTYPSGSTEFFYDILGREIQSKKTVASNTYQVSRTYDAIDRVLTLTYPDNSVVSYTYNPQGISTVSSLQPGTLSPQPVISNITYTPTGQFTSITYGNGATTTYEYNPLTLRLSHLTTQSSQGKLQDLTYQFDTVGSIKDITDTVNSATQSFVYDDLNRLTQASGGYGVFSYTYDSIGNMLSKEGNSLTYGKSGLLPHAVTSLTGPLGPISFDYDANGNMIKKNALNLTYDTENRLSKVEDASSNVPRLTSYVLTPGWNFISFSVLPTNTSVSNVLSTISGKYNQVSRFNPTSKTSEHYVGNSKYDQFTSFEPLKGYEIYITGTTPVTLSVTGLPPVAPSLQLKTGYNLISCPNKADTPVEQSLSPLKLGTEYSKVLSYDTQAKKFLEYSFAKKEFASLKPGQAYYLYASKDVAWSINNGPSTTSFVYDGDGGRTQKNVTSGTSQVTSNTYIGSLYEESTPAQGSGLKVNYIFAGSNRICSIESSNQQPTTQNVYYYHSDHLGSSNVVSDGTGKQVGFTEFTPYGSTFRQTGTYDPKRKFTGKELDASTGFYYYGARYYDASMGRFIQADSIVPNPGSSQSLNRYSYCDNNPINYTDPTGHFKFKEWFGKIIGGIAGIAGAILTSNAMVGFQIYNFFDSLCGAVNSGRWGGFAGGLGGDLIGGMVGGAITDGIINQLGTASFTFGGGFLIGATEMGSAGFGSGFGEALGSGSSFVEAMKAGGISGGIGAITGGLIEGTYLSGNQNIAHCLSGAEVGRIGGMDAGGAIGPFPPGIKPPIDAGLSILNDQQVRANFATLTMGQRRSLSTIAIYKHYGYIADWPKFAGGMRPESNGTTDIYFSGRVAQQLMALPVHDALDSPPNAFYNIVVDRTKTPVWGPRDVEGRRWGGPNGFVFRTGGGKEFLFPLGTSAGSVTLGGLLSN